MLGAFSFSFAAMFELTTKMTQKEFYTTGKSPEDLGFEVASSLLRG